MLQLDTEGQLFMDDDVPMSQHDRCTPEHLLLPASASPQQTLENQSGSGRSVISEAMDVDEESEEEVPEDEYNLGGTLQVINPNNMLTSVFR